MAAFDTTPGSCYGGPAVAAFTPICSFDPLTPTTPATFDVPAPHIILPLPPQECVCFDFTPGTANASTTPSCVNQATASVSIAITPDTDCCSGKYVVTPSIDLNVPCMPFRISTNAPIVHNRSHDEGSASGHGTDGGVESFYVRKGTGDNCCTLESGLVLTLPDCVKYHPTLENSPQVTFCERTSLGTVATRTVSNFITLHDDPEHCTFYPEINELVLPCCSLADLHLGNRIYLEGERTDGRQRDYIDWSYDRVNCETSLSFTPNISCKCFSFAGTNGAAKATAEALPSSDVEKAKVSVTIAQKAGTTCCDGAFVITPEIEIPACPFPDVPPETHRVHLGNGGYADITLSTTDCTPEFSVDSHPVDCPFADVEIERYAGLGYGGQVKLVAKRTNCNWDFQLSATPINIVIPTPPCFAVDTTAVALNIKYKDSSGEPQTATTNLQFANKGVVNGCETFQLGTIADIDLTDIGGGGFGSGGPVFKSDDDDNAYIDGNPTGDVAWYGGGLGDLVEDVVNAVECRGPRMRGTTSPFESGKLVPNNNPATRIISNTNGTAKVWSSSRKDTDDETGEVTRTFPESITIDGVTADCVTGNLSMVLPTSFQWDVSERGVAVPLAEFVWNDSGILSYMEESGEAAIVAPGLAKGVNGVHASGLRAWPVGSGRQADMPYYGLHVDYGPGLHIYKGLDGTSRTYYDNPSDAAGALMLNDGRGLRIHGVTKMGSESTTADEKNKLEIYFKDTDLGFTSSDELVINDKATTSTTSICDTTSSFSRGGSSECAISCAVIDTTAYWTNGSSDMSSVDENIAEAEYWAVDAVQSGSEGPAAITALYYVISALYEISAMLSVISTRNVHVGTAGIVTAVDGSETTPANYTRNVTE